MTYQGVVFDLDGTLADSLEDIANSMNRVLEKNQFPLHSVPTYKSFIGKGVKNLVIQAIPEEKRDDETIDHCFKEMLEDYGANCIVKTRLYDGISDLLDQLSERGLKLAVFSNKANELTQVIAKKLLKDWKMEMVLGAGGDIPRKPDPTGALLVSEQMGILPNNLLYMGDTDIDMQTAKASGMCGVGVLWGFRTQEELESGGARMILEHPMDLLKYL